MKILIVDDELYARKALAKRIDNILTAADVDVYEAEDVETAKRLLERVGFDLVFSDVCMPGENGLELVAYLMANQFIGRTFIVSGHAEFEYAQKAMELGVKQYLLKPVSQEQLKNILDKAAKMSMERCSVNIEQTLDRLVQGDCELAMPFAAKGYRIFLMEKTKHWELSEYTSVLMTVKNYNALGVCARYSLNHKKLIVLCSDETECTEMLTEIAQKMQCVIGVSMPFHQKDEVVQAFAFANAAVGEHIVNAFQKIFYYHVPETVLFTEAELVLFSQYLETNTEKACKYKEKLLERIAVARREYVQLEVLYHRLVVDIQAYAFAKNKRSDFISFSPLMGFENLYSLNEYLDEIIQRISTVDAVYPINAMEEVVAFLQENYFDFISMETLAREKYYMNPKYFSKVFKEHTGQTFSKYLAQIRMENAQRYLEESTYTVSQVAIMCGYNSVSNFIRTFKNYYGETPKQHDIVL
ncbi:MAG: helix-turn-helix domain-containing protein [Faecalibacterium sp.]